MRYSVLGPVFLLLAVGFLSAQTADPASVLKQGEELFLQNKPSEAKPVLETALRLNPTNEKIYLYLGTVYEELGQYDQAVNILQKGTTFAKEYLDVMYYNIGNDFFMQNKNTLAEDMYSKVLEKNPAFSDAYLNRANTRVRLQEYAAAVKDYTTYLSLRPEAAQKQQIDKMLALLNGIVGEQIAQAKAAEEKKKAEEARQKALLNDVLNSLNQASQSTKNLSAQSQGVETSDTKSDIVD